MSNLSKQLHFESTPQRKADTDAARADHGHIAPDCAGLNFYDIDPSLRASLAVNMDAKVFAHFEPYIR